MVLPACGATRIAWQPSQRHAAEGREAPFDPDVAAGDVRDALGLVKPDRDSRAQPQDQCRCDPALRLRERERPAVLLVA